MSLLFSSLISGSFSCAVDTPSKLVVGTETGLLRVYGLDLVLERELRVGKQNVSGLAVVPSTEIVAVICDRKCSIHDLKTRRKVCDLDSTSAKYLVAVNGVVVLGSSYKLRIVRFPGLNPQSEGSEPITTVNSLAPDDVKVSVVSVDQQRVRALGVMFAKPKDSRETSEHTIFAVIGQKLPKLWRIDLAGSGRMVPIMNLDPRKYGNSHGFCVGGTDNNLVIGCSSRSMLICLEPLQIVCEMGPIETVTVIHTKSTHLALLAVLKTNSNTSTNNKTGFNKTLEVINPVSGSSLFREDVTNLVGPSLVTLRAKLARIVIEIKAENLLNLPDGAIMAFKLPSDQVTDELRDLERREVAEIFARHEIDEAMRLLLLIEEQETSNFSNYKFASDLLLPYLEETEFSESSQQSTQQPSYSSVCSGITAQSGSNSRYLRQHHALDSVVQYLTYTRRKLRLRSHKQRSDSNIDTALFLCYLIMQSPLLISLLRSPNECDPNTVESNLLEKGKWRELIWFYKSKGSSEYDRKALDLLKVHNESPQAIIAYLESVTDLQLVFEYAEPVLKETPSLAQQLFYEKTDNEISTQPKNSSKIRQIYDFLEAISPDIAREFAIFRVLNFGDETEYLHDVVAILLAKTNDKRLLPFLETSEFINAAKIITDKCISQEGKAVLYLRLGNLEKSIDLYISLKEYGKAQKIAEEHGKAQHLFNKLLTGINTNDNWKALICFLNTVSTDSGLEINFVLQKLPNNIQTNQLRPFLNKFVVSQIQKTNNAKSLEAISRRTLAEQNIQNVFDKSKKFTVTTRDACNVCHKTLGRSVTAVTDDQLIHYKCLNNN